MTARTDDPYRTPGDSGVSYAPSNNERWEVPTLIIIALALAIGLGFRECSRPEPPPELRVPSRVTAIDHETTRIEPDNPRGSPRYLTPAVHVVQLDTHIYVRATERQLRGLRVWDCVWVRWDAARTAWVYEAPAPKAACPDQ